MPDTDTPGALTAIRRLRAQGARRPDGNPQTASIGIAECIAEAPESSTQLVEIADHRMYTAKQAGKDCICAGEEEAPEGLIKKAGAGLSSNTVSAPGTPDGHLHRPAFLPDGRTA